MGWGVSSRLETLPHPKLFFVYLCLGVKLRPEKRGVGKPKTGRWTFGSECVHP